ncbi:hypothetical protein GY45DRAFT_375334 [Cubamyces sp. BRFM 1775]|nr:hypothetical protein GY45DRAFT_375334 [Cubamyces sp. BRFM 1775]
MSGKVIIVGYDEFMDLFVPAPPNEQEPTAKFQSLNFERVATRPEAKIYQQLADAFNQDWLMPKDTAVLTHLAYDSEGNKVDKTVVGVYLRSDVAVQDGTKTRLAFVELPIGCKDEHAEGDLSDDCDDTPSTGDEDLRQLKRDSAAVFEHQRRVHLFTLFISDETALINRWDRSGVVETAPFNFVEHPELLGRFVWRFARMSAEQRGHDPTATRIDPDSAEYRLMEERATPPQAVARASGHDDDIVPGDHARAAFAKSLKGGGVCWRLEVDDAHKGTRYFLVGRPHYVASGIVGRGTQTFVAIDQADPQGPFVYLKDVWRITSMGLEQEGRILERLNSNDDGGPVPFVPTVRCHGDVENQQTCSQKIWRKKHPTIPEEDCPLKAHRHYRLVVNEVGIPMTRFTNMEELVSLFTLCIYAHGEAYNRKGLIHRDISAGNVLIHARVVVGEDGVLLEDREPLLADWELAKNVYEPDEQPHQSDLIGTWRFLSATALSQPSKRIIVQDDIESLFHLLLYHAIRFLPHNCDDVGAFMDAYFDGYAEQDGLLYGGAEKLETMRLGRLLTPAGQALRFYMLPKKMSVKLPSQTTAPQHNGPPPPSSITHSSSTPSTSSTLSHKKISPPKQPRTLHPVNNLFAAYLQRLSAFYTLYGPPLVPELEESRDEEDENDDGEEQFTGTPTLLQQRMRAHLAAFQMPKQRPQPAASIIPEPLTPERRAELQAIAATLGDHKSMSAMFLQNLASFTWPRRDRCPDRLPPDLKPERGLKDGIISPKRCADVTLQTSDRDPKRMRSSVPS